MRVLLKHREGHATADAVLCAMTSEHLATARTTWLPAFERRLQSGDRSEDFLLWERGFMSPALAGTQALPTGHVLLCGDRVEGIVITAPQPQSSWRCPGAWLTYVRYLATAPWNRDGCIPERGYFGIGKLLVARAVLDSIARGHDGRIGLHSLPGAKSFYDSLGFTCAGTDPLQRGMTRFELPPESVVLALAEIGAHLIHNPEIL
jgi:hypothetical protein